jgi:hypothetical protein
MKTKGRVCKNMRAIYNIRQSGVDFRTFFTTLIGNELHVP